MKTNLLVAAAIALTALAVVPPGQAMELPPPCQTASMSTCCPMDPSFAPCCTLLTCPPVLHCPTSGTDTVWSLISLGSVPAQDLPVVEANTNSDCSADACASSNDGCSATDCQDGGATCCEVDARSHDCTCQTEKPTTPTVPIATSMMALPTPHPFYQVNRDCTVTAGETYDCPNGFWDSTIYYTAGPVHIVADSCTVMCACMPIEIGVAE
jgi:hypothetical protein